MTLKRKWIIKNHQRNQVVLFLFFLFLFFVHPERVSLIAFAFHSIATQQIRDSSKRRKSIATDRTKRDNRRTIDIAKKKERKEIKEKKKSSFFLYGSEPFISIGVVRLSFLAFRFYHPVSLRATARIGLVAGGWMGFDRVPLRVAGFLV